MTTKTYTRAALVVFVLLGAIDFIDTFVLIRRSDGEIYESNPIAASLLKDFGWEGLAVFKVVTTLVLVAAVLLIQRRRPRTAAILATLACLAVLIVALYSRNLLKGL